MARRKRYSEEFKRQALRRADEPGVSDALVCEELGISTRQLRRWRDAVTEQGTVDESVFESKHRNVVNYFRTFSLNRQTWHEYGERIYDRRFVDYVNDKVMPEVE